MLKFIKKIFKGTTTQSLEEIYLSQSTSLEDLERRQKQIMHGKAPWNKGMYI